MNHNVYHPAFPFTKAERSGPLFPMKTAIFDFGRIPVRSIAPT